MATPHVTGAIAAYAAAKPNASAATIREAILKSAVPTASLAGKTVTGGRLSVLDAINYVPLPTLSIASASAAESVNGVAGAIEFKVTLSAPLTEQITVNYGTTGGTAAAGVDYTSTSGTLTFIPGDIEEIVRVDLINDNLVEPNETFFVDLSGISSSAVALGTGRATGTIVNDDSTQISINDVAALESAGTFRFTVSLSRPSTSTVTVRVATANGTARSGKSADYNAISGTLSFAPGVVSQTVSVTVRNDTTVEPNETFFVNLSSASGATIADSQGIGTILNDDGAGGAGGAGGPNRFFAGGSPDSLSANDWMDLLEGFGRRRGQRR